MSNMTETRSRLTTADEAMLECARWIHVTLAVRPGLNPETGKYEERIYCDVDVHRWIADDFPEAVRLIKDEFVRVASDPRLRDSALMAPEAPGEEAPGGEEPDNGNEYGLGTS